MDYRVSFFQIGREKNKETGELEKTDKQDYLGSVVVDDNLPNGITLISKAFRQATAVCLLADKVLVEKL